MSDTRKAEILAAEECFRRARDLADRLAESGVYLIGPLNGTHLDPRPGIPRDLHPKRILPAERLCSAGIGPSELRSLSEEASNTSDPGAKQNRAP